MVVVNSYNDLDIFKFSGLSISYKANDKYDSMPTII